MRYLTSLIFALELSVAFVACGAEEAVCAEPVANPGGIWCMTSTNIETNCRGELYPPHDFFFTIFQEGSDLSAASNWGWLEGTICGDQIRMSGEGGRDDLTTTATRAEYLCRRDFVEGLDFLRSRRHLTGIAGGLLEGHGTDAAKVAVAPFPIVKHLDVIEQIAPCLSTRSIDVSISSFLSELKNDSATALSQQLPRRLMLVTSS